MTPEGVMALGRGGGMRPLIAHSQAAVPSERKSVGRRSSDHRSPRHMGPHHCFLAARLRVKCWQVVRKNHPFRAQAPPMRGGDAYDGDVLYFGILLVRLFSCSCTEDAVRAATCYERMFAHDGGPAPGLL